MKRPLWLTIFCLTVLLLSACAFYSSDSSAPASAVQQPKPLAVPVGKNWQIIEEAPQLSDGRGTLPFQKDQSTQPDAAKPAAPEKNRTIETQR